MNESDNKYPVPVSAAQYGGAIAGGMDMKMHNPTIGENIDMKIRQAEERLQMLKENKVRMEKTGLLDIRIHDLRQVMDY
jgi:hypothetical protein